MRRFLSILLPVFFVCFLPLAEAGSQQFRVKTRSRVLTKTNEKERYELREGELSFPVQHTAVIIVDMWDTHHCYNAVQRVVEMAPRMNEVIEKCRAMGITIIHAPSSCMDAYKDHPGRAAAKAAPTAKNLPKDIGVWCHMIPSEEKGKYPIDQKDGGCDSDPADQKTHREALIKQGRNPNAPWKSQYAVLKMADTDFVSDSGVEIWNLLEARKINNVIIMGVHTNMCVLGRPFGLRQLVKNGKNVVLMRDMTDTMYNPKSWPYVNHYKGTELIVEHIEKFVAPTITSNQIIGGKEFKFKADPN